MDGLKHLSASQIRERDGKRRQYQVHAQDRAAEYTIRSALAVFTGGRGLREPTDFECCVLVLMEPEWLRHFVWDADEYRAVLRAQESLRAGALR